MARRPGHDHTEFRNIVNGSVRRTLTEMLRTGEIFMRGRPVSITIPSLNVPDAVNDLSEENGHRVPRRRRRRR